MPHPRQRTSTAILATLAAVVGLSLVSTGAATATSGTAHHPDTAHQADTAHHNAASATAAKPDAHVAQAQRTAQAHYQNAPCNRAQKDYQQRALARCFAVGYTTASHDLVVRADGPPATALGPEDIQSAYNLPDSGSGSTVAIVDAYGYATAESDLATFRAYYGLPACTTANGCFTKVDQTGGTNYPPEDAGWSIETALDLDAVSSACPKCNILLVEGDDNSLDNLGAAADTAASLGADAISNSYGVPGEDPGETDYDHYYDHPGVAVVASTGDAGNVTNWPATSDQVAGIGGTSLTKDGSTRGWTESAWVDGGSGCSPYEPRPDYQAGLTTNCPDNKAIADISADADPETGLGIYNSTAVGGWAQYGGTSLAAPLIGAMYALAGHPVPDTYPVSYPYNDPSHLNDVTTGANGACGNVLCESGPGWDGPTGLGTPDGVSSLTSGPHGTVSGTVTNASNGNPLEGATVSTPDGYSATTDSSGHYTLSVPVGTYTVKASAFGFATKTDTGVVVDQGQTVTESFALNPVASHVVSGAVTDGSGQGWPVYAKITVDGTPATTYTNPYTGRYSLSLPSGSTYAVHVESTYPGYLPIDKSVKVANANKTVNLKALVDPSTCSAKGYAYQYQGTAEDFTGWTGTTPQDGWTVTDATGGGQTWDFDNPGDRTPPPGSDGDFAIVDSDNDGFDGTQDTTLVSPVIDMSSQTSPELGFDSDYKAFLDTSTADVDVSTDGGATWTNVWEQTDQDVSGHVDIPLPDAAGKSQVQVRFHYVGAFSYWWGVDNVFAGNRTCKATGGGLVAGIVRDGNTNLPVNGAKVASVANPDEFGVSAATPDDANVPDGFYWLYSSATGRTKFQATDGKYTASTGFVNVQPGWTTHKNWSLAAGHLTVSPSSISDTLRLGASKTETLTFGNDGTKPVHVDLSEQNGDFTPMVKGKGAPVQHIKGTFTTKALVTASKKSRATSKVPSRSTKPSAAPWTDIADFPTPTMDNAVAYGDGKVYSVAGYNGTANVADGYVYDSSSQAWTAIADAPAALESPAAAYVGGKVYLVGGWDETGDASHGVYAYDPSSDSWAQKADLPEDISAAGTAVLDGDLYVIGGCTTADCAPASTKVFRYDAGSDSWTAVADFPQPIAFTACAGLGSEIVCGGGVNATTNVTSSATYAYSPAGDSWTKMADMPADLWGAAASGSGGELQVSGGVADNSSVVTNEGYEYDPSSDTWADLPAANNAEYRGGGSCGMYQVGGSTGGFAPTPYAELLPGYDQCGGGADVPWLSEDPTGFDVAPGATVSVTVTLDASAVDQPGTYEAKLGIATDSPYPVAAVPVTMQVTPPASWGKIRGTVTNAATGDPIVGATVAVCTMYDARTGSCGQVEYTLKTDADGTYQLWLDRGFNPLQVIAAKDGYSPKSKIVKIVKGGTVTADFALKKN